MSDTQKINVVNSSNIVYMTIFDHYAAAALTGIVMNTQIANNEDMLVKHAFKLAEKCMQQREKFLLNQKDQPK